ncbi:MAG TPA: bifunctional precorrin-2 dehydrogenase/sirohydrochlorin ferrochelatase [Elusimicrobiota bacterium]|nr:bifunctional precorrin-2 dehydrogenase/sirohydrochlorin ferrochelatase [Elusimicrobiota bacterium]
MSAAAPYPAFLRLDGKRVLLVGGGPVAARKARDLARCGARVKIVAPRVVAAARRRAERVVERRFRPRDLDGAALAVCATGDEVVDARVSALCRRRGIWANVVDRPALCDFIVPAVVRRGPLAVAFSSGGASPFMARRLRRRLQGLVTPEDARLAAQLGRLRPRLLEMTLARRRRFLAGIAAASAGAALRALREDRP